MSISVYKKRIKEMRKLFKVVTDVDQRRKIVEAIDEEFRDWSKATGKSLVQLRAEFISYESRPKRVWPVFKCEGETEDRWIKDECEEMNGLDPVSTLNPDGISRRCECGAKHTAFPNHHMNYCPMKQWK